MTEPCHCPTYDPDCTRRGRPMSLRAWELCSGKCPADAPCTPADSEAYREHFDAQRDGRKPLPVRTEGPPTAGPGQTPERGVCRHLGRRVRLPGERRKYKQEPSPD